MSRTGTARSLWAFGLAALACCALAVLGFWRSWGGGFLSDDYVVVRDALYVVAENPGAALAEMHSPHAMSRQGNLFYRPLTILLEAVEASSFGGEPLGYRLVGTALHAVNGMLLLALVRTLSGSLAAGMLAAALFLLFPANAEPMAWFAARADLYVETLHLAALLAFVRHVAKPNRAWLGLAIACAVLGLAAKETGVVTLLACAAFARSWRRAAWVVPIGIAYLCLRKLLLGTVVGGYPNAAYMDPSTGEFWSERLDTLRMLVAPVHGHEFGAGIVIATACVGAALLLASVARGALARDGLLIRTLLWLLFCLLPTLRLEMDPVELENSRFAYQAMAPLCAAYALTLHGSLRSRLFAPLAISLVAWFGVLHQGNLKPWLEAGRASRALNAEVRRRVALPEPCAILVADLAGWHHGAVFARTSSHPMFEPPFVERALHHPVEGFLVEHAPAFAAMRAQLERRGLAYVVLRCDVASGRITAERE